MSKPTDQQIKSAIALYNKHQFQEALEICENVAQLDPTCARAYHGKGLILVKLERHREAIKSYEQARSLAPNDEKIKTEITVLYATLGKILYDNKEYEQAGTYYRKAIKLDKDNNFYYKQLTRELLDKAIAAYSYELYQRVLLFNPTNEVAKDSIKHIQKQRELARIPESIYLGAHHTKGHRPDCRCHECWEN